ncbi:unnamed protein product [Arabis nemorensis]|uniref:RNase H type-1 domain-containing protein n=1 Tax=Arabis nemorensis TaxID=586526 RepID=A0A565AYT5_9BRAS|nr:unnamed protein product [Arabis nemorensis]
MYGSSSFNGVWNTTSLNGGMGWLFRDDADSLLEASSSSRQYVLTALAVEAWNICLAVAPSDRERRNSLPLFFLHCHLPFSSLTHPFSGFILLR